MVSEKSRWDLPQVEVASYMTRSFDYIVDLFNRFDSSEPFMLDPSGDQALRDAKRVRRAALRAGDEGLIADRARASFGMPETRLGYASALGEPLYPAPTRDMSS